MSENLYIGIDLGTSGARAVVIDDNEREVSSGKAVIADDIRSPPAWRSAVETALRQALDPIEQHNVRSLCIDGTSGTVLAVDRQGKPLAQALMYNDPPLDPDAKTQIEEISGKGSTDGYPALLRAQSLLAFHPDSILHQADWISFLFSGRMVTDHNNALKTGYSSVENRWPQWMDALPVRRLLPEVIEPGTVVGPITPQAAQLFDLPPETTIVAGTTDGCASFLASGATHTGEGVTVLGTTITIKLLSDIAVNAPEYGVYSHRLLGKWLVGGASNSGGAALLSQFSVEAIERLSHQIDPSHNTGLDYYPLPATGERFPINDPQLLPRMEPRPNDDVMFLQGIFEGMANIEARSYNLLEQLGAPSLKSVRSMGGGAKNLKWSAIRASRMNVAMIDAASEEAAYGVARLARLGAKNA